MSKIGLLFATLLLSVLASAQQKFSYDSVSHSVTYKQNFKLSTTAKEEDVFAAAEKWFSDKPGKFTQKNANPPIDSIKAKKNKNKIEVDKEFGHIRPLQSLDPSGGKIVGLGLLEYYGGSTTAIRLFYLKYDIYLKIEKSELSISVSNLRYFHFNPNSYAKMGIYSFSGGQPCEAMSTMEYLVDCENSHKEFSALAEYFNKDMVSLFADLKESLKTNNMLYVHKASVATAPAAKSKAKAKPKKA